jgi:hypothetical protein
MGQIAGEPEQLELEREYERIECRLGGECRLRLVEEIEEASKGMKGRRVSLLFDEKPEHRLEPDVPDRETISIRSAPIVGADEVGAANGLELPAALVQEQLDVAERLQPAAEARARLANALGDRADAPLLERVQVEDAVGLAEADGAEDDRLGLRRAGRHGAESSPGHGGILLAANPF